MFDAGAVSAALLLDRGPFQASLDAARAEAAKGVNVPVSFDVSQASAAKAISAVKAAFAGAGASVPVSFGVTAASVGKAAASARAAFAANPVNVPVTVSISNASVLRAVASARAAFRASPITVPVTFGAGGVSAGAASANAAGAGAAAAKAFQGGWMATLGRPVSLFGGLFGATALIGEIPLWHLLVDWVVEFAAVLIPASIALGAFGLAGMNAAKSIITNLQNVRTVSNATGQNFNILTGHFAAVQAAVKPEVFQLWGDALTIAGHKSGLFSTLATSTGHAVDLLGARFALAITQGKGMGGIMATGAQDVLKLGTVLGNLGGTLGTILRIMPGFAAVFLNLWVAVTKGIEALTSFAAPALNVLLWAHGIILYGGLAVTALIGLARWIGVVATVMASGNAAVADGGFLSKLGAKATNVAASVAMAARAVGAAALATWGYGAAVVALIGEEGLAATATLVLGDAMTAMAAISDALTPWGWVALGVAAMAGLIFWIRGMKTETQTMIGSLDSAIMAAPTVARGAADILSAQLQVTRSLITANRELAASVPASIKIPQLPGIPVSRTIAVGIDAGLSASGLGFLDSGFTKAAAAARALGAEQAKLGAEQVTSSQHVADLTRVYGNQHTAMGLVYAAGITEKQWLDKSAAGWALVRQQVNATQMGFRQMGVTGGALGNDLQVMNKQVTDQYQAMTKLNGALDTWIKNVTGTQTTFDTFAQGQASLATSGGNLTLTLGKLTTASTYVRSPIDSLTASGIALNQAFSAQVGNVNALADSWRLAGVASGLQNRGIKDSIALLVPFARGSKEATAQLVALAEQAGYNGPALMKSLVAWLGNTHDALKTVKDIANQATIQEALLSSAMRGQGNLIASQLLGDLNNAILKYGGVKTAVEQYGKAIATQGQQSDAARTARATLIADLITTGRMAHQTTGQIAALITKITGIPLKRAVQIVVDATGSFRVTEGQIVAPGGTRINAGPGTPGAAKGMLVTGGVPGRDSVLINAMPGEVVVPTPMVRAGAVDHLRGKIPGFAGGGVVGSFAGTPSGLGSFDLREYAATAALMEAADAAAAAAAMKKAIAAAKAAMMGGLGTATGSPSALMRYAESFVGTPYVWGGTTPAGWDCSGFSSWVYHHFGIPAPRTSQEQQLWAQPARDQPGALVFFYGTGGTATHVGLSFGNGMMVNASSPAVGTVNSGTGGNSGFGVPPNAAAGARGAGGGLSPRIFDAGGWLPPGLTLVDNRTGKSEHLTRDSGASAQGATLSDVAGLVSRLIRAVYDNAHMTADGVAEAIGAVAKTSAYRSAYSPR